MKHHINIIFLTCVPKVVRILPVICEYPKVSKWFQSGSNVVPTSLSWYGVISILLFSDGVVSVFLCSDGVVSVLLLSYLTKSSFETSNLVPATRSYVIPSCFHIYILLYFSELEDGLEKTRHAPGPDKYMVNRPTSPEDSNGGSDTDDRGLTTPGKFYSVNFLFVCACTK